MENILILYFIYIYIFIIVYVYALHTCLLRMPCTAVPLLPEAPLAAFEPLGASKLMRAPRLYCGVALSKSFNMCITVEMSRLGRP